MAINTQQIRAARGLIGWSQTELADAVGISLTALNQIERGLVTPRTSNMDGIQKVLEKAGVEFTPHSGVCIKQNNFLSMEGTQCLSFLQKDLFATLKDGGELCCMGVSDKRYADADEKAMAWFLKQARQVGIKERVIVEEGDDFFLYPQDVTEYRWVPTQHFHAQPFYAYKGKVAFLIWEEPVKLILIENDNLYRAFMGIFETFWSLSRKPPSIDSKFI